MFDKNKKYWVTARTKTGKNLVVKGSIVEEASYMIKIVGDRTGKEYFITTADIISVNVAREEVSKEDNSFI